MDLDVEIARDADGPRIVALRDAAARWLQGRGIRQWAPGEVSLERVRGQIAAGQWHVVRVGGAVQAALRVLDLDPDVWSDRSGSALYVHGLVVDRALGGTGVGAALLGWVELRALEQGRSCVRLDCVAGNRRLRDYYRRRGFVEVGSTSSGPGAPTVVLLEKPVPT